VTAASEPDPVIESSIYRTVMGHFLTGVTVITAMDGLAAGGAKPVGMAASSFTSLSMDPPLVLFCAAHTASAWPGIQRSGQFCVNMLAADQESVSRQFASKVPDRFEGIGWTKARSGSPRISGSLAWIDCRIEAEHPGGDHVIVVGRVLDLGHHDGDPLAYYRGGYGSVTR
jgi:3-hydroxy-9,10-secoandrosta-1,3,5(10)-triene-9,17-dione monooxygenase reductase component